MMLKRFHNDRWFVSMIIILGMILILFSPALAQSEKEAKAPVDLRTAIGKVAKENIPAVVHIDVTQRQELALPQLPFENDPFFRFFFNAPGMPKKFKQELKGLGTGIIMDSRGHILTNNHVVGNATDIQVLLSNGNQYKATLIGTDPKTDLAVVKIEAKESLPHVTFGDSDKTDVGDWVVAIGHPRGLDQTVTQGIISAKHRRGITDPSSYQDFLQTDAAINPGNSGGPLLNLNGEVIGVNAAIASQSGGFEGIGFAIPSNMAVHVAKDLIAHRKVVRGWLGVSIQNLTPDLMKSFGLTTNKGALIADVIKDGPADQAGLKRGDVIVAYGGAEISDVGQLRNAVAATPVGQSVTVTVLKKGEKKDVSVNIGDLESATKLLVPSLKDRLGAEVRTVNSKEISQYNLEAGQGVSIIWLDPKGPLAEAGFELGDIILQVNGRNVNNLDGFVALVGPLKPRERMVVLAIDHRSGQSGYVQVVIR